MRIEKSWGYEQILFNEGACAKLLVYTKPVRSSLHYHIKKHETFYISSGEFEVEIDDAQPFRVAASASISLPPYTRHRVRCIVPGTIVEASTHDDPDDCVRLVPSD